MTSVICQLVMISITCCMWSGLIPVNTGYEQFFNGSTLNAQIRRNDASILASGHNGSLLSEQMVRQAMQTGCCTEKNVRVKAEAIKGGFVVWQEDISLLNTLLELLQKSEKELEVSNALLKAENEIEEKQAKIAAQTQLYDRIEADMKKTIQQIASELSEKKENTAREQLFKISVIGTYMKRRCNLLFLGQKNDQILLDELLKSDGWYYVLTDGDVSEYAEEDGGLAYEGDVYFDFDVENIFGDEDGNLYALGNGGPLVRWGTEEDEVLLNYCVMVSLHPSGKKAVGWSYSNSITEYDFETGTNKEHVIDLVEDIKSVSVTKDYQAVCGYKGSETLLNIYDNNWNEVMTISSTDIESGMLEDISAFEQTQNGWVIFDSWMENVIFVGFDGAILKEISYEELFGTLNWPYVNGTCMDEEGNVIVAITDQREDASCYETIIFKLKGF